MFPNRFRMALQADPGHGGQVRAASERLHRLLPHADRLVIDVPVIGEIREMVK